MCRGRRLSSMPKRKGKKMEPTTERDRSGVAVAVSGFDTGTKELRRHLRIDEMGLSKKGGVKPARVIDTLETLKVAQAITLEQFDVGRKFQSIYHASRLEALHAPDLGRSPGQAGGDYSQKVYDARKAIGRAIMLLGGEASITAQAVVSVLGDGKTHEEWASEYRFRTGRPLNRNQARERLLSGLEVLAGNWWAVIG